MSEKDQEQFMKHTPVEGAPQFDVAAPAFVPKEEAEDLVVPEASGLSVTESKAMKEEADEPAVSETVEPPKVDEATVGEHPDVVATPQPTPPFQPAPQAPQNMATEPIGPQTVPVPETPIPQAPLSPVGRPMDTADKKAIRFALGILVGLLIGGVSGYLIGHASPSTSPSKKHASTWSSDQSDSTSTIDLDQLTAEDAEADFSWKQSDIEQLQFLTGSDAGETPEEMIEAYGKASSVQFESGELKFGMITLIIKRSKRPTLRREKNYSLSNLSLINLGKILRLRTTLQMDSKLEIVRPVLEEPLTKSF